VSATGSWPLQVGLVAMIRASGAIMAIVSDVYDAVPENAAFPFVVVGEGEETDASSFGQVAHDLTPDIQVWDRDGEMVASNSGSAGFRRAESVAELIAGLLDADTLTVTGHSVVVLNPRGAVEKSRPSNDDPSLRLVSLKPHLLLEDS
jgi:hypothetical protein